MDNAKAACSNKGASGTPLAACMKGVWPACIELEHSSSDPVSLHHAHGGLMARILRRDLGGRVG